MNKCKVCGAPYNDVGLCKDYGILHGRGDADDDWLEDFLSRPRSPLV